MTASILKMCEQPPADAKLWRYMSFMKFTALLLDAQIYFSRADLLGDEFEVSVTEPMARGFREHIASQPVEERANQARFFEQYCMENRSSFYVSCWHVQTHETASMWRLYGQSDECVAVQTTAERLTGLLPHFVDCGMVKYISHESDDFGAFGSVYEWVMNKRSWFADEREFRAVIWDSGPPDWQDMEAKEFWLRAEMSKIEPGGRYVSPAGVSLPIDLNRLIDAVYLSPKASPLIGHLVRQLLQKVSIDPQRVKPSAMSQGPLLNFGGDEGSLLKRPQR